MNKPITNRVQKAVARGKVTQQPLLDVGEVSPLKKEKSTGDLILEGSTTAPDTTETVKGGTTTTAGGVIGGGYDGEKMNNDAWEDYLARETPERKAQRQAKEVADGVRSVGTTETAPDTEKIVKGGTTKTEAPVMTRDEGDALQPWERRWSNRQAKIGERDVKRDAKKDLRGLKRQAKDLGLATNREINKKFRQGDYSGMGFSEEGMDKAQGKRATSRGYDASSQQVRTNEMAENQRDQSMKSGSTVKSNERNARSTDLLAPDVRAQINESDKKVVVTGEKEVKESPESGAKMRMNANVGIKSKSPMKKGYFHGK